MESSRIMPRYSRIPIIKPNFDLENWYEQRKKDHKRISVFSLRNIIHVDPVDKVDFENDLIEHMSISELKERHEILEKLKRIKDFNEVDAIYNTKKARLAENEIIKKLIEMNLNVYNIYIDKLKGKYTEDDFDNAFGVFAETYNYKDISADLLKILQENIIRDPQDFSSIIQLIGLSKNIKNADIIYSFYDFFKYNFVNEDYYEGPLFAIKYLLGK